MIQGVAFFLWLFSFFTWNVSSPEFWNSGYDRWDSTLTWERQSFIFLKTMITIEQRMCILNSSSTVLMEKGTKWASQDLLKNWVTKITSKKAEGKALFANHSDCSLSEPCSTFAQFVLESFGGKFKYPQWYGFLLLCLELHCYLNAIWPRTLPLPECKTFATKCPGIESDEFNSIGSHFIWVANCAAWFFVWNRSGV